MIILLYLIPLGLAVAFLSIVAFLWAAKNGQFEDLEKYAAQVLRDEEKER